MAAHDSQRRYSQRWWNRKLPPRACRETYVNKLSEENLLIARSLEAPWRIRWRKADSQDLGGRHPRLYDMDDVARRGLFNTARKQSLQYAADIFTEADVHGVSSWPRGPMCGT